MKCWLKGQMVKIIKIEEKQGANGNFKTALFTVADRVKRNNKKSDGTTEKISDFYLCKAIGNKAELIEKYFNDKDASGKLISRKIDLYGHLESYSHSEKRTVELKVKGKALLNAFKIVAPEKENMNVTLTKTENLEYTQCILIIEDIEFADTKGGEEETVKINIEGLNPNEPIVINTTDDANVGDNINEVSDALKALENKNNESAWA